MKKKILSLILTVVLLCAFTVNIFAFNDVASTHWAKDYIESASGAGIVNGYGNGIFKPEDKVKAGEFIKMVACVLDLKYKPVYQEGKHWASQYVDILKNKIEGFDATKYDESAELEALMTRGEMSKVLTMAYATEYSKNIRYDIGDGVLEIFKDFESIPEEYKPYINFCYIYKLLNGYDDEEFKTNEVLTRAQSCKVICKLLYR